MSRLTDSCAVRALVPAVLLRVAGMARAVTVEFQHIADTSAAVKAFDGTPFMHLRNAAEPTPGNASRTYLEFERV
jgi:hypothetical protein